jgi:hypothetical protein
MSLEENIERIADALEAIAGKLAPVETPGTSVTFGKPPPEAHKPEAKGEAVVEPPPQKVEPEEKKEAPKKRKRRTKAEIEADKKKEETPAPPPVEDEEEEDLATIEDIRSLGGDIAQKFRDNDNEGYQGVLAILKKFGVDKFHKLQLEDYQAAYKELKALNEKLSK